MSPLFGRKDNEGRENLAVESRDEDTGLRGGGPVSSLDAEVARLSALSLPELAAEVMTGAMRYTAEPDTGPFELFNIARVLMPPELRDAAESDGRMRELVAEGIQVLEQARLVRLEAWSQGQFFHLGYIVTRLGRAALEQNTVARILAGADS